MKTSVLIDRNGLYYNGRTCAQWAPRYDGDDENFVSRVSLTENPAHARVYDSPKEAEKALRRLRDRGVRGVWALAVVS